MNIKKIDERSARIASVRQITIVLYIASEAKSCDSYLFLAPLF